MEPHDHKTRGNNKRDDSNHTEAQPSVSIEGFKNSAHFAQSFDNGFHPAISPFGSGMCRASGAGNTPAHPASESCQNDSSRVSEFPLAVPLPLSSAEAFCVLAKAVSDPIRCGHPLVSVAVWSKLNKPHSPNVFAPRRGNTPSAAATRALPP